MKTRNATLLALLAGAGLFGCAGTSESTTTTLASPEPLTKVQRYQRAVGIQAERKNVEVHWVNPPREADLDKYDEAD